MILGYHLVTAGDFVCKEKGTKADGQIKNRAELHMGNLLIKPVRVDVFSECR